MATFDDQVIFRGAVVFSGTVALPASGISDKHIAADAAIAASKLQHRTSQVWRQKDSGDNVVTGNSVIHVAAATGVLREFKAGVITPNISGATVTVDLRKNNVSILSAVVTLNDTHAARQLLAGTITNTAFVAGDVFEVVVTATAGGGTIAKGLFGLLVLDTNPT